MRITDGIQIDEALLEERFIRGTGPGGQHVNRTDSVVQLRFDLARCGVLEPEVKQRLARLAGKRLNKEGVLILRSDVARSQERNRADARNRLRALILQALTPPKPRKKSRPSQSSIRRVKESKSLKSRKKALRRPPSSEG